MSRHLADESVRELGAMTGDLNDADARLLACGVDTVALESTEMYWIPAYEVLLKRQARWVQFTQTALVQMNASYSACATDLPQIAHTCAPDRR